MTRRLIEPTVRFHLFLYASDHEYLDRRFGAGAPSESRIGLGRALREIIHERVERLKAVEAERRNIAAIEGAAALEDIQDIPEDPDWDFDITINDDEDAEHEEYEDA